MPSNFDSLRAVAAGLDDSDIVEVAKVGLSRPDVVRLWVGEGDLPTPDFISDAAKESLDAGETFYTWQRGIPELRQALADYHNKHYPFATNAERFFVTGSGMQSIQLSLQALVSDGDEVVMITPCWPNIHAATQIAGAKPVHVPLSYGATGWHLDTAKLFDAVNEKTRVLFINSPSNPTGWTASKETLNEILTFARERGLWILADEVYSRFTYDTERAPSFYDVMNDEDRVIFVNTFSKNWAMTGWRAGWISATPEIGQTLENLIQYSTSGVAPFTQKAAVVALRDGEPFLSMQKQRATINRDVICDALLSTGKVTLHKPEGAFYLFFKIDGFPDSKKLAFQLIDEAKVGMSPGSAFYTGGAEYLRLCYLRDPQQIEQAAKLLVDWINRNC